MKKLDIQQSPVRIQSQSTKSVPLAAASQSPRSVSGKAAKKDQYAGPPAKKVSMAGTKLAAKLTAGAVAGGGILAFAGYGMFAAAPHIGALFGTIAAAPATIPILATIGAVLATVAIVVVVRLIYKKVQKEKLISANVKAAKARAEALSSGFGPSEKSAPKAAAVGANAQASNSATSLYSKIHGAVVGEMTLEEYRAELKKAKDELPQINAYLKSLTPEAISTADSATQANIEKCIEAKKWHEKLLKTAPPIPARA